MQSPTRFRRPPRWAVIIGLALAGCSSPLAPERDALANARARWEAASLFDYSFEFRRLCFCGPDLLRTVRIEVRAGEVSAASYVDTGEPVSEPLDSFPTIDDLLEEIAEAIRQEAFSISADYHDELGHPVGVAIDYLENAIDDEMSFFVMSLQPG